MIYSDSDCIFSGLCPQLQELYHLSTAKDLLLPFPLKKNVNTAVLAPDTVCTPDNCLMATEPPKDSTTEEQCTPTSPNKNRIISSARRPLFEDLLNETLQNSPSLPLHSFESPPNPRTAAVITMPRQQSQLFSRQLHFRNQQPTPPPNSTPYDRATPWPEVSVLRDWRVVSGNLFRERYCDTHDIQSRIPWIQFENEYQVAIERFSLYASPACPFGQRVVIHAHHFPGEYCAPKAPALQFGEGMPSMTSDMMSTHFWKAVECTGLNVSLVAVPQSSISVFDAVASSMYATRLKTDSRGKQVPRTATGLIRSCINWLLEESNAIRCMNVVVSGANSHLNNTSTIIENLCRSIVLHDPTTVRSLGTGTSTAHQLLMYKSHLQRFRNAHENELLLFANKFFPDLNSVFIQVLCEMYCDTVTVIDYALRGTRTYTSSIKIKETKMRNIFLFRVCIPSEYYYGLFDTEDLLV